MVLVPGDRWRSQVYIDSVPGDQRRIAVQTSRGEGYSDVVPGDRLLVFGDERLKRTFGIVEDRDGAEIGGRVSSPAVIGEAAESWKRRLGTAALQFLFDIA